MDVAHLNFCLGFEWTLATHGQDLQCAVWVGLGEKEPNNTNQANRNFLAVTSGFGGALGVCLRDLVCNIITTVPGRSSETPGARFGSAHRPVSNARVKSQLGQTLQDNHERASTPAMAT